MHQSIDGSNGHHRVSKDRIPLTEGLVGGNEQTFTLIAMGNEFKQYGGFRLRLFDIAQVVQNNQVKAVELFKGSLQLQMQLCLLKLLHQGNCWKEFDPFAKLHHRSRDGGGDMSFANAGSPKDEAVV